MMNDITQNSCRIECHADKQESCPVVSGMAADEMLANNQQKIPMLKSKRAVCISTFNAQTLNTTAKLSELVYNAQKFNISLIAIQEHRLIHEELLKHDSLGDNYLSNLKHYERCHRLCRNIPQPTCKNGSRKY